jgi:hypothetical protein
MTDDEIVDIMTARAPVDYDTARKLCNEAIQANAWERWARGLFRVPDDVSRGELRQWIGERLANGDISIVRIGEDP